VFGGSEFRFGSLEEYEGSKRLFEMVESGSFLLLLSIFDDLSLCFFLR